VVPVMVPGLSLGPGLKSFLLPLGVSVTDSPNAGAPLMSTRVARTRTVAVPSATAAASRKVTLEPATTAGPTEVIEKGSEAVSPAALVAVQTSCITPGAPATRIVVLPAEVEPPPEKAPPVTVQL
jgi:hypothetical protein